MSLCDPPLSGIWQPHAAGTADGGLRLSRDAIGHKSLYWTQLPDRSVIFASTMQQVLADARVPRQLNRDAVPLYLACAYVPGSQTLVQGVHALPPGHALQVAPDGQIDIQPFWQLPPSPQVYQTEQELLPILRDGLLAAVQRALPDGQTPVAATLSGGIDSSLVLALARHLHPGDVQSLSVHFGRGHKNELDFSSSVAAHLKVPQTLVEVTTADIAAHFDVTVGALSEPNGDPLTVPNYLLFQRAASLSPLVLNGEGGDPCFGGPKNAPMLLAELLADDAELGDFHRESSYLSAHQRCYDDLAAMLHPEMLDTLRDHAVERIVTPWFIDKRWPKLLDQLMALNITWKGAHHILPKIEALSRPHGVVGRSPLFDRQVVELSFQIPAHGKRRGAVEKYLLKEMARQWLPQAIVDRPKSGMLVPVEHWFNGPLLPFARQRLLDGLAPRRIVRKQWLEALLDAKLGGLRPRRGIKIWLLLTLEAWLRNVLDK